MSDEKVVGRLLSIQVGRVVDYGGWRSGFGKHPVDGPVWVDRRGLPGDQQADLENHGGPEKAVLVYAAAHYPHWEEELGRALLFGAFGENFTVDGLTEADVAPGQVCRIGEAVFQVTRFRRPCWKIARYWGIPTLTKQVYRTGRTGWYLRVLQPGWVRAGDAVVLLGDRTQTE